MKIFRHIPLGIALLAASLQAETPSGGRPLVVCDLSFADGVPSGWDNAEVYTDQLPDGSKGAIRAKSEDGKGLNIRSDTRPEGFFPVEPDLHMHIRLRMNSPEHFNLFCMGAPKNSGASKGMINYHTTIRVPRQTTSSDPTGWRIISVPFKDLRITDNMKGSFPDTLAEFDGVVARIFIDTTGRDLGMAVDRIWFTRGGPGEAVPE